MQTAITTTHQNLAVVEAVPVSKNPAAVYVASLASGQSRYGAERSLDAIARLLPQVPDDAIHAWRNIPWQKMGFAEVAALRSRLAEKYAPSSANRHLATLRGVLRQSWLLGYMDSDEYRRIVDRDGATKKINGKTEVAGRHVKDGELDALVRVCAQDATAAGARDAAIISMMAFTSGLRRAEVVELKLADWNAEDGTILIRGKGRKERRGYIDNGARAALEDWLHVRGDAPGPLFCPVNKAGTVTIRSMSSQSVYNMLKKRAEQAGVSDFSPHDLRRTIAGNLLDAGVDLNIVAGILGHANVETTARYDRRPDRQKRAAVNKLHFAWKRRYAD